MKILFFLVLLIIHNFTTAQSISPTLQTFESTKINFSSIKGKKFDAFFFKDIKPSPTIKNKYTGLSNISFGFGFAKAIRYKDDEFTRDNNFRLLFNMNVIAKICHPLYLNMGFEYNKEDLRGYEDHYSITILPSFGGSIFSKKATYFIEAGPNLVLAFRSGHGEGILLGLSAGLRCQYNITEIYAIGINIKHINYFNIWSEHYFIVHSNLYFSMKI